MSKNMFKIGSFNLFNLVLPEVKYYTKKKYTQEEFQKKKEWISLQLDKMDADIVGFQEIFHQKALEQVVLESKKHSESQVVVANPNGNNPVVGCVSKFPILDWEIIEGFPEKSIIDFEKEKKEEDKSNNDKKKEKILMPFNKFSRPVLKVRIGISDSLDIMVYIVHLKSKRPKYLNGEDQHDPIEIAKGQTRSLMLRAAEATALRSILMEDLKEKKRPVIVLGDVNDSGLSVTTKIVSGEPPYRYLGFEKKKKIWDILLYHAKDIQARQSYRDFYFSHIYNGHYESLDHILVSEELVRQNPDHVGRVVYVSLFNDHLVDETLTVERVKKWHSDHGQVVAFIEMKD
jgi:hypothetical protein